MVAAACSEPPECTRASGDELGARVYFPELDGLRAIAFLSVYAFHAAVVQSAIGQAFGKSVGRAFRWNGWVGVQLFFILSGFLITTLLLNEEARFGRIDIRAFWIRRAFRIWPLYYLCVVIGFVVMPWVDGRLDTPEYGDSVSRHLLPHLLFLGNWSQALRGPAFNSQIGILWTVCVEEQFYLVVPLLIAWVPPRFRIRLTLVLMVGATAFRAFLAHDSRTHQMLIQFNTIAQFDTLLSGVLLALVLGKDPRSAPIRRWARWLQWPLFAVIVWGIFRRQLGQEIAEHRTWDFVAIWACGMALVAVAVTVPGLLQIALSNRMLVWLGKISYGLYMYHEVAFWLKPKILKLIGWIPNAAYVGMIGAFVLTVLLAAVSYYLYERPFLRLRKAWTRIPTRPL